MEEACGLLAAVCVLWVGTALPLPDHQRCQGHLSTRQGWPHAGRTSFSRLDSDLHGSPTLAGLFYSRSSRPNFNESSTLVGQHNALGQHSACTSEPRLYVRQNHACQVNSTLVNQRQVRQNHACTSAPHL